MIRLFHRWPALLATVLLLVLAVSGTILSVFPAVERTTAPAPVAGQTVADLAGKVIAAYPGVEQIRRAPSGKITAYWFDGNTPAAAVIDPATGLATGNADPSALQGWLTDLHRALFLQDLGRWITAAAALALLVVALTGAALIAQRQGGWSLWFSRMRGPTAGRWHGELARVAVVSLVLSSGTALWMTAATFELLPVDDASPALPAETSGLTGLAPGDMSALAAVPVTALRDLTFPYAGEATDVFTLTTTAGMGYVDQGTGALLAWQASGPWTRAGEWIYLMHTGEGAALWGLILGLLTLSIPALSITGIQVWLKGRKARLSLPGMVRAEHAETILLVASESGSTLGFARALGLALQEVGGSVHLAPLAAYAPDRYAAAKQVLVLAATWGNGDAPVAARGLDARLAATPPHPCAKMAILGFGDRSFPAFCAFAERLDPAARQAGWSMLLPLERIDRQSAQAFARWSRDLGQMIGYPLDILHQPEMPRSTPLRLVSRQDYGEALQAPTAILTFALPQVSLRDRLAGRGFPHFHAGDLLGILPVGSAIPRFYSLASGTADGFVEIVVKKQSGGLCSGQLMDLEPGQMVRAFIKPNPGFRPDRSKAPLLLIGAGTGIGPLAGFIRANRGKRPIHLWFGARHPQADFLYADALEGWSSQGHLASLNTAFSRTAARQHVQDRLRTDADRVRHLVGQGARIMVCGGRDMATGVRETLAEILAPLGLCPDQLRAGGRYAEDTY